MDINHLYETYLNFLKKFISFKSISTDLAYSGEIRKTANWLGTNLSDNGFKTQIITGYDNPLVFGHYEVDPKLQTILIYGHYDVQPASIEDGWSSDPFTLTEDKGRLVARGSVDNKGQIAIYLVTVFELIKQKKLKYNIKFLIEGNEETGSPNLDRFISDYKNQLSCDLILISDGEITANHPIIEVGFRGVVNATVTVTTSDKDLHSGLYGGASPNSGEILSHIIASLTDEKKQVLIEGFYDDVLPITHKQRDNNALFPYSQEDYRRVTGTKCWFSRDDIDLYSQLGLQPSLEITGLLSGYTGVGYKNAIPQTALAKFNLRLVKNQNPEKIKESFVDHIKRLTPDYATSNVIIGEACAPVLIDTNNDFAKRAENILKTVWGKPVLKKFCGGSIPITLTFQEIFGVPQLLIPFGNEDCNMHGANENFEINLLKKDIDVAWNLLS